MWHVHGYKNNTEKQESKVSQYFLIVIFPVFAQVSKVKEDDVDRYSQKERKKARKERQRSRQRYLTKCIQIHFSSFALINLFDG